MMWECFSTGGTERVVAIEGKMSASKYRDILDENLRVLWTSDWAESSPSNKTMTLSTPLK